MTTPRSFWKTRRSSILPGIIAFFVLLTLGCSKKEGGEKTAAKVEKEGPQVVARVGDRAITVQDFKKYLSERPISKRSPVTKEDLQKRLDGLVLEEVIYQEALRLGLEKDPEVRSRIRQMLNQKVIDDQVNQKEWNREITEIEVQEYYKRHWDEFNRPDQVRVADIFVAVPADATSKERAASRKKAETVLDEAFAAKGRRTGFGTLVSKYSDKHKKYSKGDTGFFDIEGKPVGVDKKFAEAAFNLERVGSMAEHVIESPEGFHVVMLVGKRAAIHTPLERVQNQIKQRIRRETVARVRNAYFQSLKEESEIEINTQIMPEILEKLNNQAGKKHASYTGKKPPSSRSSAAALALPGEEN